MTTTVEVNIFRGIATITFNRPKSLNAITSEDYDAFAEALRVIDKRDDVVVTVWQATGKWFCAGTHVGVPSGNPETSVRQYFLNRVTKAHLDVSQALFSHSKILVAALNGPTMGIAAAYLGYFDFIYALPNAWISLPFSFLGIIAEAGSSATFVNRIGVAKANELLIFGKKMNAEELLASGFLNKIFPEQSVESFHKAVRDHLSSELEGLDADAMLITKDLLKKAAAERNDPAAVIMREGYAQAERFMTGVPAQRFSKIARKEIKHKL
ncbi:Enoyl-CoA hydratase/isomerase and chromodomain-containing protein [Abortiporus biennis]